MIWENIKMAFMSLTGSKLRSFLTMLGIIIGIAAVVSINSVGEGVKKQVSDQITGLGTNVLSITSGKTVGTDKSGKKQTNFAASVGTSTLTQNDIDVIGRIDHVAGVAPISIVSGLVSRGDVTSQSAFIIATTPAYADIRKQTMDKGRFITNETARDNVAVMGSELKKELFDTSEAVGQSIKVRGVDFKVIGVVATTDTGTSSLTGPSFDNALYIPTEPAKALAGGNSQILRIVAQADSSDAVEPLVKKITEALKASHNGQEDFSVLTQKDLVSTVGGILDLLSTFVAAIASIALLVGGIGIMNMMLVTVTERTREIGIRKALGATRSTIAGQFLIEAIILSLIGGLLGVLAAFGMGYGVGSLAKVTPVFTIPTMSFAFGISVLIGIVFGLAPAIKASRKRPIEALRYE